MVTLDLDTIVASVRRTGRLVVAHDHFVRARIQGVAAQEQVVPELPEIADARNDRHDAIGWQQVRDGQRTAVGPDNVFDARTHLFGHFTLYST